MTTVPAFGVGIRPRGPSTLPRRLTLPIMSCVARATSKSSQPSFWTFLTNSSLPAKSAPASLALATLSPWQKTSTRTDLADAVRQRHAAANHLIALRRVDAQRHVDLDGLVELGPLDLLEQRDGLA